MTTSNRLTHRAVPALAVAISALVAAGSGALVLHATPVAAREVDPITVTKDSQAYREYPPIPDSTNNASLAFTPDPEDCRTFTFCDTVPVKVPIPDIPKGDDYKLRLQLVWDSQGGIQPMEIHLYDNKQLKEKFGQPQPGDSGYDPRDKGYTRLTSDTDPEGKWIELGQPDLIDYNLVVVNTNGQNFGYAVRGQIEVDAFVPPDEKLPPAPRFSSPTTAPTITTTPPRAAPTTVPTHSDAADEPSLTDLAAAADPDLQAIREQNLDDVLAAPQQLVTRSREQAAPPEPPSGIALLLGLVVVPGAVAGAACAFLVRRRRMVLAFG